ncbi:sterile alpha motif domain-containing protein 1 isoform X2 [Syngnathoides biaculeatus]|uniref:sterile alpha motif domain-containing protein 1 isoform X2 n=1 Tax=Syngnathoides biaculeatus TaxID=300417 RepID=UPI002ADE501D|nr:sterile alpha motif domain-containing protein 1 isoform X2 [Syngnathoides biaculeatus]
MSGPNKYQEWILETIDSLRSRKARPDLERICRMVRRRHGSDPDRTRAELEKLIQEQTVLKVSYKGSISYRNAAKVQRKSRKKSEEPQNNNNGDSALSFTDQEDDAEPSPSQQQTATSKQQQQHHSPTDPPSGNGSIWGEGTAAAAARLGGQQKASASTGARAVRPGHGDASGDDTHGQTYAGDAGTREPKLPAELATATGSNSNLGDRLVASVRSLSERSLRGTTAAANKGPVKPLGLKEILGYLSSQERLSEEKLTRGKVKMVMERELARGRLRRTRCGNITLPLGRLTTTALASAGTLANVKSEPMEEAGEEDGVCEDSEEEEGPRSSNEAGGPSLVSMTTTAALVRKAREDRNNHKASEDEENLCRRHRHKIMDPHSRTGCPPPLGASPSLCITANVGKKTTTRDQPPMEMQSQIQHTQSRFDGVECKTEVGMSSCLLTPTASPRDSGLSEEHGMNGGVTNGGFVKMEGGRRTPVDWTVSDVVTYFTLAGFPEQAAAFGSQEIDGRSLLLMQRNDVLTGLAIRLGPALKIYERHVKVLQKAHFDDDECT